jgi:hypothetical protein
MFIQDPGSWIQQPQKRRENKICYLIFFVATIFSKLKSSGIRNQGSEIRDPRSEIRNPISGIRKNLSQIQVSKKLQIPDMENCKKMIDYYTSWPGIQGQAWTAWPAGLATWWGSSGESCRSWRMPSSSLPTYRDKHLEDYPTGDKER